MCQVVYLMVPLSRVVASRSLHGKITTNLGHQGRIYNVNKLAVRSFHHRTAITAFGKTTSPATGTTSLTSGVPKSTPWPRGPRKWFSSTQDLEKEIETKLRDLISNERVLLLLKGTPESPQCGFSAAVVNILDKYKVSDYAYVDVLSHDLLRPCAKRVANWPTFPQLFVKGQLVGGCDVIQDLHESGSLGDILYDRCKMA